MKVTLIGLMAGAIALGLTPASAAEAPPAEAPPAEAPPAEAGQPAPQDQQAPRLTQAELDQLLAPVALYPDTLLGQILMAATYPLQVVQADRWLAEPSHAALKGGSLAAALQRQDWDPSVKSLAPFPRILRMMDLNLDWTERLGDAFLANQPSVLDTVQRLRRKAQAAGSFRSNAEQVVDVGAQIITIAQPNPDTVYLPAYDPWNAYGLWPDPVFPPYYFPGPFDGVPLDPFGFGWVALPVIAPLWGWNRVDWGGNRIAVDPARWTALNRGERPAGGDVWEHSAQGRRGATNQVAATAGQFVQPRLRQDKAPLPLRGEVAQPPAGRAYGNRVVMPALRSARPESPAGPRPAFNPAQRASAPTSRPPVSPPPVGRPPPVFPGH